MCLAGSRVFGPSSPNKCRICTLRYVNSQSSINSDSWFNPSSLDSGICWTIAKMASTIALLYSKPPSSRRDRARKLSMPRCLAGNLTHNERIASTTTILNSSASSPIKPLICFINLSIEPSLPVFKRVVIAKVAIDLLLSATKDSISMLQLATSDG